jgi:signal transduction histidine kinase
VHEIRQPLAAILANAEAGDILASGATGAEALAELHDICGDIRQQCSNADAIVDRLKKLARKRPLELKPLQLNDVVGDVLLLLAHDAQRRGVRLDSELTTPLPSIEADRVALQQVLLNLIVNSMDAMDLDEMAARRVFVRTLRAPEGVEVAVTDTGHGIPAEALPKLFDAFFTTKQEGVGLGLAIARSIVEAHRGRIWAEPHVEGGATFRMALPIPRPSAA